MRIKYGTNYAAVGRTEPNPYTWQKEDNHA
jgi:hypothetical protein